METTDISYLSLAVGLLLLAIPLYFFHRLGARLIRSTEELVAALAEAEGEVCVLPTYTAMLPLRAALAERCGGKEFWK